MRALLAALCLAAAPLSADVEAWVPAPPTVALPAELARVLSDYERAWQARDASQADLFDENGFVLSPGAPPARGREAIRRRYAGAGGPLALRAFACGTDGSIGYILGGFSSERGKADSGKFTLTLRRASDGRWRIFSDMDNGNARSRPATEAHPVDSPRAGPAR
jgi:ketosteroid isomerase-like protein